MARESAKDVRVIDPPANYSVIGKNVSVGFGQSVTKHVQSVGGVTISRLPTDSIISKILLKAIFKKAKNLKTPKTFTLRNINTILIRSPEALKREIQKQFREEILTNVVQFDVGYQSGSNMVYIRSSQDLVDIWTEIAKGQKHILWCDGLRELKIRRGLKVIQMMKMKTLGARREKWMTRRKKLSRP